MQLKLKMKNFFPQLKMKNSASVYLKHMISVLCSMAKNKSMAIKSKTDAMRARLIVFSLVKNKKLSLDSITHRIHAILGQQNRGGSHDESDQSRAIVLYNASEPHGSSVSNTLQPSKRLEGYVYYDEDDDDDGKYPDLRHSLFDEADELDLGDPNGSVIDLVRNSKEEGEEFSLEDEIDHVADLFIMKFHKKMRMQKLASFKRYQEMLERSA
ncbi:uncharacterized protein LOC132274138 [Cornus florida]|uniref:uncharacterized protein LOC132274138 n=1 Tax=Cornus florida TaxID=4283 RepID=UPI0028968C3D|nr:uncharacterized protein LOC132274138 [Cornus florida]